MARAMKDTSGMGRTLHTDRQHTQQQKVSETEAAAADAVTAAQLLVRGCCCTKRRSTNLVGDGSQLHG